MAVSNEIKKTWWKESVIYQVYPRSFQDSNGDGVGDLRGLINRLDYLKELGIDIIWLSPMYKSPNDDNGYDISDYYNIMDEFGTMADFDELMAELKKRELKIILDLVVNHSSDEHAWFKEARKSKDNPYRDYYIWKPGKNGGPPNDWVSFFSGSAWEYDEHTDEYYLHLFTRKQPDLNWENPKLRQEVYKMMRFWLDKGVSGFRMDVIPLISKNTDFPDFPADYDGNYPVEYASGPRIHEYLQEMHREVLAHYDCMTVGEGIGVLKEEALDYVGEDRNEISMIFHFDHMFMDRAPDDFYGPAAWTLADFKKVFLEWGNALGNKGWDSLYLGNHDFPRMVSRFGNDAEYRVKSAKLLGTLLFTLKGTPYIYQGDEIGMTNTPFNSIDEYNDVSAHNYYRELVANGGDTEAFVKALGTYSRDHARTPVQWSANANAGFTEGKPWLKINPNFEQVNVEAAKADADSIWHYYKKLITLRKSNLALVYGTVTDVDPEAKTVFAYTRTYDEQVYLVVLNMDAKAIDYKLPGGIEVSKTLLLSNYAQHNDAPGYLSLQPYEARVYKL